VEGKGLLPELSKKRKRKAALLVPILAQLEGAGSCVCFGAQSFIDSHWSKAASNKQGR